jgi:hypothetical protein
MITDKITRLGVAVAVLGLGMFAACSEDNVASSYSETQTGKPIAEWAESYIPEQIKDDSHIGLCKAYVESAVETSKAVGDDEVVVDTGEVKIVGGSKCISELGINMKTRVQVVDGKGNPVEGARVSRDYCSDGDTSCQYIAGKDGYAYMGNQLVLTVGGSKPNYSITFESFSIRVFSPDSSLGLYGRVDFSEATIVEVEGDTLVELKKVVLEPLYKVKVYLDSLYSENDEKALKRDDVCHDSWTKAMWDVLNETRVDVSRIDVEDNSSYVYPSYRITKENCKNGYVVLYGLPEGTYKILIDGTDYELPPLEVKP